MILPVYEVKKQQQEEYTSVLELADGLRLYVLTFISNCFCFVCACACFILTSSVLKIAVCGQYEQ